MKNNVTPELAFALNNEYAQAMSIIFSEFEGAKFNTDAWRFEKD